MVVRYMDLRLRLARRLAEQREDNGVVRPNQSALYGRYQFGEEFPQSLTLLHFEEKGGCM